jgi:hypothetical protein
MFYSTNLELVKTSMLTYDLRLQVNNNIYNIRCLQTYHTFPLILPDYLYEHMRVHQCPPLVYVSTSFYFVQDHTKSYIHY